MKLKDLLESPQSVGSTEFGLDNVESNKKFGYELLNGIKSRYKNKTPLRKIDGSTLWELKKQYALIRDEDHYVSYYMKFEFNNIKFINRMCVSQVAVWRSKTYIPDPYITKTIFQDLIFKYKTVITDSMQTEAGQRFWALRIADALMDSKLYVYYLNYTKINQELIELHSQEDYGKIMMNKAPYGDSREYQAKRFVITTDPF